MDLFPIGTLSATSSQGSIESVTYSMFEPNLRCKSSPIFTVLDTRFDNQTLQTRQKAEPYLSISYEYEDIFEKEYSQIEHFIYTIAKGGTVSFFVVDFSKGVVPTGVSDSGGDWVVSIPNTRLFSTVLNRKASRAFLWNGAAFKEGRVIAITANTSITVNVDGDNYGSLVVADANADSMIYPLYEVYVAKDALSTFSPTNNLPATEGIYAGYMRSGTMGFFTRYKV